MSQTGLCLTWESDRNGAWSQAYAQRPMSHVVFVLEKLPNFAEPRFRELGEQLDDRRSEVARRQLQMLRQFHSLGSNCGVSFRLCKVGQHLRIFVVARITSAHGLSPVELDRFAELVQRMFPAEYGFDRLDPHDRPDLWAQALDVSWSNNIDEVFKAETPYPTPYPAEIFPYFYVSSLWQSQALNDLEALCRQLLNANDKALVDITVQPTAVHDSEWQWVDRMTQRMREAQRGDRISGTDGRLLERYAPMPMLQAPVQGYEAWLKRYDGAPVFLYSIRVFGSDQPGGITQTLSVSALRSQVQTQSISRGDPLFDLVVNAAHDLRVLPEVHNPWWDKSQNSETDPRPWRVQRIHRMVDVEEIASFWRFPIPMRAGFPGFELDIGTGSMASRSQPNVPIELGDYADVAGHKGVRACLDREGLVKHGLIVGVPGSGKTTAVFSILHQLWLTPETNAIPFIVLEPAKTEYRALKTLPGFEEDMLVFTLGNERISPFRFNPFHVPKGISLESHIARLNACFSGAFSLVDPLPLLLDQAIREAYADNGWLDDSVGGESGLEAPTLGQVCAKAEGVLDQAGYVGEVQGNIRAALLQRLNSLRRGSKGRMLDTRKTVPFDLLMNRPVILELDALNGDEKALLMMFILTLVYEYAKANRRSGTPLSHVLVVEEAHNLIGRNQTSSDYRATPQIHAIRLFIQMLAEMRALGQGILIADQLPTAIAPEAMKQTNLKMLMRMTAMDDRTEIGNTMDLEAEHLKAVSRFKAGQAFIYHEGVDRVREVRLGNFKENRGVAQPPGDDELGEMMGSFEQDRSTLYMPFSECSRTCATCNRRVRNQVERFVRATMSPSAGTDSALWGSGPLCDNAMNKIKMETVRIKERYGVVDTVFPFCAFVHLLHAKPEEFAFCQRHEADCMCQDGDHEQAIESLLAFGAKLA